MTSYTEGVKEEEMVRRLMAAVHSAPRPATHGDLPEQLCVRPEPHELQGLVVGQAVDQHQVGFEVAVTVLFPGTLRFG